MSLLKSTWFKHKTPQLILILITLIWGGSFVTVQYALNFSSPILFVAFRFLAAGIAVSFISYRSLKQFTRLDWIAGLLIGTVIAIGYTTQTIGLQTITSSESAFLTALYVPLVPIMMWLIFKNKAHFMTWMGSALAFVGLVLLTGNGFEVIQLNFGQTLTLLGSIAIALEIILIGHYAGRVNIHRVTVLQLFFASALCFVIAPIFGESSLPNFNGPLLIILFALGLASACIQLAMNWAQRVVDPAQAAIIYAGEPIWAALFGRMAGERLPALTLVGGCLVVIGVILSQLRPKRLKRK